jgi:GNAT superfamily N-acetyltransferase
MNQSVEVASATIADVDQIKRIADANRQSLGFLTRGTIAAATIDGRVLIARWLGCLVGFATYRHRKDGQTTLLDLCVDQDSRNSGVGASLVDELLNRARVQGCQAVRLKCPRDLPANRFYEAMGFTMLTTVPGRKRSLNVWEYSLVCHARS